MTKRAILSGSVACERRYHAAWVRVNGLSPLALLAAWLREHPGQLEAAPLDLLVAAESNIARRLPGIAVREPSRRHRKHFAWLLGWKGQIALVLRRRYEGRNAHVVG